MASGYTNHFDGSPTPGVLPGVAEKSILLNPGDIAGVRAAFASDPRYRGVIYEPTGSSFGQVPLGAEFAQELRRLCTQHGALLIFDEVVTGFRATKGGAQMAFNVRPDLSSFAKIVAGGLPGACVAGRKDMLDLLDFQVSRAHRAGEDRASRHVQRQSSVGRRRHRGIDGDRGHRALRTMLPRPRRICERS